MGAKNRGISETQLTIRLSVEQRQKLEEEAEKDGRTLSNYIRRILMLEVEKK